MGDPGLDPALTMTRGHARSRAGGVALATFALAVALVATLLGGSAIGDATGVAVAGGFRHRHADLVALSRDELPWTSERTPLLPPRPPRDRNGVPMMRWGGRLYYRPGEIAINGMKRIEGYLDTGKQAQLDQALLQARFLRRMALTRRHADWLPFWFDYPAGGQRAPWFNAMGQGLVLSFFVRLHALTGDPAHLDAARLVFRSFRRSQRSGGPWVAFVDRAGYLWLEHYPTPRPTHVLNAHLWATFGLYEYWQATRSRAARELLEGAILTMRDHAHRYRRPGALSRYDLRTGSAFSKYHEIHVWQLRLLARISGERSLWRLADRLREDVRPAGYVPGRPRILKPPGAGS